MIIKKHYIIIAISLLFSPYLHSKPKAAAPAKKSVAPQTKPAVSQAAPVASQLSQDVNILIDSTFPESDNVNKQEDVNIEDERIKIYEQLGTILSAILDKKNTLPMIIHIIEMKKLLTLLNQDNKLTDNRELQAYFKKATRMEAEAGSAFKRTLPQEIQNDLKAKEIYDALHFILKNKDKQGIVYSTFWIDADAIYHFKRIMRRLLPSGEKLPSTETIINRINSK